MRIATIYAGAWYKAAYKAHKTNSYVWKRVAEKLWQKYLVYYKMIPTL